MFRHPHPLLMLFFAELFFMVQGAYQLSTGLFFSPIAQDFNVSLLVASLLKSAYYYMYVGFQTPAGIIMDKIGPRKLLTLTAFLCCFGSILFSQTHQYYLAFFAQICIGGGAAFAFVGILRIIREWFPQKQHGFLIGLSEFFLMFAAIRGIFMVRMIMQNYDWHFCLFIFSGNFLIISILCGLWIRDTNPAKSLPHKAQPKVHFWSSFKAVITHRLAWINGLYIGSVYSIASVFAALWATPFFEQKLHISTQEASKFSMALYIGLAIGCPLSGWLSEKWQKRRPFLIFSSLATLCIFSFILYWPFTSIHVVYIAMFLLGFCSSGYITCFLISDDISPKHIKNTYTGFTNACCLLTAVIFQPLIGGVLQIISSGQKIYTHTLSDLQIALSSMMIMFLLSIIFAFRMPETYRHE